MICKTFNLFQRLFPDLFRSVGQSERRRLRGLGQGGCRRVPPDVRQVFPPRDKVQERRRQPPPQQQQPQQQERSHRRR